MTNSNLLTQSTRIAMAAYLHDLGKFAERAKLPIKQDTLDTHIQMYCKKNEKNGKTWYSHKHAAYTALGFDLLEKHMPALVGNDVTPFGSWKDTNVDNSLLNASAKHHTPDTFLQWVIATADRAASGFDRESWDKYNQAEEGSDTGKNHYQARMLTLFEQISLTGEAKSIKPKELKYRYPLTALSPEAIFPQDRTKCEPSDNNKAQQEYLSLWNVFTKELEKIPNSHRHQLPLWLDHFDSLWLAMTHAIPSATAFGTRPDVSLYDHSKTTAALATALWRYHKHQKTDNEQAVSALKSREDWDENKFLLIQSDFFGIQKFIFASGGDSTKKAARLLRGRSFYVSLIAECAALKVLEALDLPSTSQVTNAAGKFLIVAPNTKAVKEKLAQVKSEINQWFLDNTYGQCSLGLAWTAASCNDFVNSGKNSFSTLMNKLHSDLEISRHQAYALCQSPQASVFSDYLNQAGEHGICAIDGYSIAQTTLDGISMSYLAKDQIMAGKYLANKDRLLITKEALKGDGALSLPLFGYHVFFTDKEEATGKFGNEAQHNLRRAWDYSLPESAKDPLYKGYARRYINTYVPLFTEQNNWEDIRYTKSQAQEDSEEIVIGLPKTFNHIANEDRIITEHNGKEVAIGISALGTIKGDIDNLGMVFSEGISNYSFARMAALSRQVNQFFTIYLPWLCKKQYPNTYTVFAGGDDFFLLGPWYSQIKLSQTLYKEFNRYVARNPEIHFSAGIAMSKPGLPMHTLETQGEEALDKAKQHQQGEQTKNAVTCFERTTNWPTFNKLIDSQKRLTELSAQYHLSTAYLYDILSLVNTIEMKDTNGNSDPRSSMWRSHFSYRTERMVVDKIRNDKSKTDRARNELALDIGENGLNTYKGDYRIALQTHLYLHRD